MSCRCSKPLARRRSEVVEEVLGIDSPRSFKQKFCPWKIYRNPKGSRIIDSNHPSFMGKLAVKLPGSSFGCRMQLPETFSGTFAAKLRECKGYTHLVRNWLGDDGEFHCPLLRLGQVALGGLGGLRFLCLRVSSGCWMFVDVPTWKRICGGGSWWECLWVWEIRWLPRKVLK